MKSFFGALFGTLVAIALVVGGYHFYCLNTAGDCCPTGCCCCECCECDDCDCDCGQGCKTEGCCKPVKPAVCPKPANK